jgi:hypothetical protein
MRALTMDEVGFVSGGVVTDGDGNPIQDNRPGWDNYRNPVKGENKNPIIRYGGFEATGERIEQFIAKPISGLGKVIDEAIADSKVIFHNQMVETINRDRNADGRVTDAERNQNFTDWQNYLNSLNGN